MDSREREYLQAGEPIGAMLGVGAFIIAYVASIAAMGWILGLLLGWIPASMAYGLLHKYGRRYWPLALLVAALVALNRFLD